jgi:hypothetical protein
MIGFPLREITMFIKLYRLVIFLILCALSFQLQANEKDTLKISVDIDQRMKPYEFLFDRPSLLVLAIKNSGFEISQTRPILLSSLDEFSLGAGRLKFVDHKNNLIRYKAVLSLNIASVQKNVDAFIDIDTQKFDTQRLELTVHSDLLHLIPDAMLNQITSKLTLLLGKKVQSNLITYLQNVSKRASNSSEQGHELVEYIIQVDSYNYLVKYGNNRADIGEEVTLYEQKFFFSSILGWAVFALFSFLTIRKKRKKSAI